MSRVSSFVGLTAVLPGLAAGCCLNPCVTGRVPVRDYDLMRLHLEERLAPGTPVVEARRFLEGYGFECRDGRGDVREAISFRSRCGRPSTPAPGPDRRATPRNRPARTETVTPAAACDGGHFFTRRHA